jgi:SAM-dependent methyltransferase
VSADAASYDDLPYEGSSFPQTHPLRLAAIAVLRGLEAPAVASARVLEIGCGDGSNLLPLAEMYPKGQFLGIDLGQRHIEAAVTAAARSGLGNVVFERCNVADFDPAGRSFDFIIAHGIFSWVPESVRRAILAVVRRSLSPLGVAFISYNALPGWHARGMIREVLRFHTAPFATSREKLAQARALLAFLGDAAPADSPHGAFLRNERRLLASTPDSYLLHEYLEGENRAFYLSEFAALAKEEGLEYLGDADWSRSVGGNLQPAVRETLGRLASDRLAFEQYGAFVSVRGFHRSLLVLPGRTAVHRSSLELVRPLWFSSPAAPVSATPSLAEGVPEEFVGPSDGRITTPDAVAKAILIGLGARNGGQWAWNELVAAVGTRLAGRATGAGVGEESIAPRLKELIDLGWVEATPSPYPAIGTRDAERPRVGALARWQAQIRSRVTNRRHRNLALDAAVRWIVARLDGSLTVAELEQRYAEALRRGEIPGGGQERSPEAWLALAREQVATALRQVEEGAFLVPCFAEASPCFAEASQGEP